MSWRKITFIVVALIVLLGGSAALSKLFVSMKPEQAKRPDVEMKRSVKVETVNYAEITSPLSLPGGRAVSGSEVLLVSEASGKIEPGAVVLRKGTSFKKGQLLAQIYKDEVELALKARKAQFLTTMTSLLPDMKIDFPDQLNTYETFFRAIDLDQNLPEMPVIQDEKLKVFLASRGVLTEYYGIKQDEKRLKRHTLYAPFDGTFIQVNYETGSYVNTGGQIARMIRTDNVEIEVPVPNVDSEWIKIGDKVFIHSNQSNTELIGKVVRKSDFIEAETQSRSIFVKVGQADSDRVLPGQLYAVTFPGQKIPDAMEIPRGAVFNSNTVYIVVNGELKKREINVIKRNETTLVFNGLPVGAKVVAEPLINVKENTPVNILGEEENNGQKPRKQASAK
ncbi:efflux RND transporter periplasmic adaptor subunit [uncultured Draconibacterium sp.]|uniref:efflux RND transporter periplasmic adaptor subunit n=1 Tax=uncultured Draconibacterium sp. TaxID=1573823 RepID=UPI0025F9A249|nr:efflux RND transporter periplasmic adaptor subunit [uncultured Draconibacterium sp.]